MPARHRVGKLLIRWRLAISMETPPSSPRGDRETPSSSDQWIGLSGVGVEFVAAILLPGAGGWWLDRICGTAPWIMLLGGLLGFAAGLVLLIRAVK